MKKKVFNSLILLVCSVNLNSQTESSLSLEDKIYGLSVIWKEASYNFAFFDQIPLLNWDSCYQSYIPIVSKTGSDMEYYRVLEKFMANLQDGHTRIFPPQQLRNKYFGSATKSIKTKFIEDKVIVTDVLNDQLKKAGILKGMEIIAINDIAVKKYAEEYVKPYMFAGTPQDLNLQTYCHFLLSGSTIDPVNVKILDFNGKVRTVKIYREPWLMEEEAFKGEPFSFRVLSHNIGYLQIHNFVYTSEFMPKFDSIYLQILNNEGLIIDVRNNFGGATQMTQYILKHFTDSKLGTVNWKSPMNIAAHKAWNILNEWHEVKGEEIDPFKDRPIYKNPIILLADESSFSAAEDFCLGFIVIKRGRLIGNSTAGSTGSPLMFNILNGGLVLICTKKDVFPDGTEFVGYGIKPDITIELKIEDIKQGIDKILNAGINDIINK